MSAVCLRIALCFVAIFILWDIKSVFYAIWGPLDWLVGYADPRKPTVQDRMHGEMHMSKRPKPPRHSRTFCAVQVSMLITQAHGSQTGYSHILYKLQLITQCCRVAVTHRRVVLPLWS